MNEREITATVFEGAASTVEAIGRSVPGEIGAGLLAGAALGKLVALLVRELGTKPALETLRELKRRIDAGEGVITAEDLAEDDEYVSEFIAKLFRGSDPAP